MIIILNAAAPTSTLDALLNAASADGLEGRTMLDGRGGTLVGVDGALSDDVLALPGIEGVHLRHKPYMMASLEHRERSVIRVGDVEIGGDRPVLMAGPCVVESRESCWRRPGPSRPPAPTCSAAEPSNRAPRPTPSRDWARKGCATWPKRETSTGLPVVTEVMEPDQVDLVAHYADMLQVGSRNMANFPLLRRVGRSTSQSC